MTERSRRRPAYLSAGCPALHHSRDIMACPTGIQNFSVPRFPVSAVSLHSRCIPQTCPHSLSLLLIQLSRHRVFLKQHTASLQPRLQSSRELFRTSDRFITWKKLWHSPAAEGRPARAAGQAWRAGVRSAHCHARQAPPASRRSSGQGTPPTAGSRSHPGPPAPAAPRCLRRVVA